MNKKIALAGAVALTAISLSACDMAESLEEEQANDTPSQVKAGAAFTHDDFKASKGWKVVKEKYLNTPSIKGLKITNNGDDGRTALLTFRFYKGKNVLAEVECSSNEMQKGEVSKLDCFSTSENFPKGYDTIKVSDMW